MTSDRRDASVSPAGQRSSATTTPPRTLTWALLGTAIALLVVAGAAAGGWLLRDAAVGMGGPVAVQVDDPDGNPSEGPEPTTEVETVASADPQPETNPTPTEDTDVEEPAADAGTGPDAEADAVDAGASEPGAKDVLAEGAADDAAPPPPAGPGPTVVFQPAESEALTALVDLLKGEPIFGELADAVASNVTFARPLPIEFRECGGADAFYVLDDKRVVICYELIALIADQLAKLGREGEEHDDAVVATTFFVMMHQVGHAVVDLFDLPITGRVEDAVDQAATYMLLGAGEAGARMALASTQVMIALAAELAKSQSTPAFWTQHGFNQDRLFSIACWTLGSDPEDHAPLVESWLPLDRSVRCPERYRKLTSSWDRLMRPYLASTEGLTTQKLPKPVAPLPSDGSRVSIVWETPKTARLKPISKFLYNADVFDDVAAAIDSEVKFEVALPIRFSECGVVNAHYQPEEQRVTVCYELVAAFREHLAKHHRGEALDAALIGATFYTLFHQIGHAVVDLFDLPITGREEDAADQLATWMLMDETADETGAKLSLAGAEALLAIDGHRAALPFWDEHALGQERFYNVACWVYGRAPERHPDVADEGLLSAPRARGCRGEYERLASTWDELMAPWLKNP